MQGATVLFLFNKLRIMANTYGLHKEYKSFQDHQIKFSISFNRDQYSWATSQRKEIGYQVTVTPIRITQRDGYSIEESGAFTGFNDSLLKAERQSSKRLQEAIKILHSRMDIYMDYFSDIEAKKELEYENAAHSAVANNMM
jgi:hypothetical protein